MGKLADTYHSFIETPIKLERHVQLALVLAVVAIVLALVLVVRNGN